MKKDGKFRIPTHDEMVFKPMNEYLNHRDFIWSFYFRELFKKTPQEARKAEYQNGKATRGATYTRLALCNKIFEASLFKNNNKTNRGGKQLTLEDLTETDKHHITRQITKFVETGQLKTFCLHWLNDDDLIIFGEFNNKKALSSGPVVIPSGGADLEQALTEGREANQAN